jgi:hypothetical protein
MSQARVANLTIPLRKRVVAKDRLLVHHGGSFGRVVEPGDIVSIDDPLVRSNPQSFRWPARPVTPEDLEEVSWMPLVKNPDRTSRRAPSAPRSTR